MRARAVTVKIVYDIITYLPDDMEFINNYVFDRENIEDLEELAEPIITWDFTPCEG